MRTEILHIDRRIIKRGVWPELGVLISIGWVLALWFGYGIRVGADRNLEFFTATVLSFAMASLMVSLSYWGIVSSPLATVRTRVRISLMPILTTVLTASFLAGSFVPIVRYGNDFLMWFSASSLTASHAALLVILQYSVVAFGTFRAFWFSFFAMAFSVASVVWFGAGLPLWSHLMIISATNLLAAAAVVFAIWRRGVSVNSGVARLKQIFSRPSFFLTGFLFVLSLWYVALIHWQFTDHEAVSGGLIRFATQDASVLFGFLILIPGGWVTHLFLRKRFIRTVSEFVRKIEGGASLTQIRERRDDVRRALSRGMGNLVAIQGIVGLGIVSAIGLEEREVHGIVVNGLLFAGIVGGGLMISLLLFVVKVLMAMGKTKNALSTVVIFFLGNLLFSSVGMFLKEEAIGVGMGIAAAASFGVGMIQLKQIIGELEFEVFSHLRGHTAKTEENAGKAVAEPEI